jgi:catechol 2,3-dioxygenase-like lactoylglutathione lyase family enzyme
LKSNGTQGAMTINERGGNPMIKTTGIVHFTIPVSDIDRSLPFYTDVLGMRLVRRYAHMAFLRSGEDERMVILGKSDAPVNPESGDATHIHHAFQVDADAYDDALAFMRGKGIEIIFEEDRPSPATIAGRRFYVHDPDRHVIEIIDWTNPGEF